MTTKIDKKILDELSDKYKVSVPVIEKIVRHQFEFVKDTIAKGDKQAVRLAKFGLFRWRKEWKI